MSRKNVFIADRGRARRRGRRRREPVLQEGQGADGHDRGHQDARSRGDRLGVGQDPAEAHWSTSAPTPSGRVVNLAVNEGDRITKGQFLLQIDPKTLRTRVDSGAASLQAARQIARSDAPGGRDGARPARAGAAER